MMPIIIKGKLIGNSSPLVCVPITSTGSIEILASAKEAVRHGVDAIEWRADFFDNLSDNQRLREILEGLRDITSETVLIVTVRTQPQGGEVSLSSLETYRLLNEIATAHAADLIDLEFDCVDDPIPLITRLHDQGSMVIASTHDFSSTPSGEDIISKLEAMAKIDADILKVAYTPSCRADAFTLMGAVAEFTDTHNIPVIGISMGQDGLVSRFASESFGSCLTFGMLGVSSAPGQPNAIKLSKTIKHIHSLYKGV
jgi:3-dehydroquinate dehydratase-1